MACFFGKKKKNDGDVDSMIKEKPSCFAACFGAAKAKKEEYYEREPSIDNIIRSQDLEQSKTEQDGYGDIYGAQKKKDDIGSLTSRASNFSFVDFSSVKGSSQEGDKNNGFELASSLHRTQGHSSISSLSSEYFEKQEHKKSVSYIGELSNDECDEIKPEECLIEKERLALKNFQKNYISTYKLYSDTD